MREIVRRGMCALVLGAGSTALAVNHPPNAPTITEPFFDGRIVNPSDVHMETGPFSDPDPGDTHLCTDWEIWTITPGERVWVTSCIGGVERVHTHLGDGVFENSHAGRRELLPSTDYKLRVRHRDNSGVATTEWSPFSERLFSSGGASQIYPLELQDITPSPTPTIRGSGGSTITLPAGSTISMDGMSGAELTLRFTGAAGGVITITNPPAISQHKPQRVVVSSGAAALNLPTTDITVFEDSGERRVVYLPALTLAPGQSAYFWVSASGSTYVGTASQTAPDFTTLARTSSVPWLVPTGYVVDVFATGLKLPVGIAFVPTPVANDPTAPYLYIAELYGDIKVVNKLGQVSTYVAGLLNFNPTGNFPGSGEQGVGGLCIEPATGDLFVTLVYSSVPGVEAAPHYPKVIRMHSTDGGYTAATQTTVLDMPGETQGQSHFISNVSIGPDGKLYVHMGDGFDADRGLDLTSFRGKVLRLNQNGTAPTDNPLYNASNGITATDYIYAYGFRNPFGGAWRALDAKHYTVENGPTVDRFSRTLPGVSYGFNGTDASMYINAIYNWTPPVAPVNIAFVQTSTYGGSGFPADRQDHAFITLSGPTWGTGTQPASKRITEFLLSPTGVNLQPPRDFAVYTGEGKATAAALAAGPDGLYFSDLYKDVDYITPIDRGANILRVRYVGNAPPPDCNSNGVPDDQDIANGTSQDCNKNAVPDSCEIASGQSIDCNHNGIPDECEVDGTVSYNFTSTAAPFTLGNDAALVGGAIRLVPGTLEDARGTATRPPFTVGPNARWRAEFDFRIVGVDAFGFSFMSLDLNQDYSTTSFFDENGPFPGGGSLGVGFDTYDHAGEGDNVITIWHDGTPVARSVPSFRMNDGQWHRAIVVLKNGAMTVRVSSNPGEYETAFDRVAIPGFVPFPALFGFGARYSAPGDEPWIDNATFALVGAAPMPLDGNGDGVIDTCSCVADVDDGSGTGTPDGGVTLDDLLYYLFIFDAGNITADVDDGTRTGTPDGGITIDDLLYFLFRFDAGC